jgi:thiosulfate/3-mercaptopyruvate sulfurtransferase
MGTKRGGHIPGAIHLEWSTTLDSGTKRVKPTAELRAMFADAGVTPDKEVIAY